MAVRSTRLFKGNLREALPCPRPRHDHQQRAVKESGGRMANMVERRRKSGMSQFLRAKNSGIPRMRLLLAETGQIALSAEEEAAVRQVLTDYIAQKSQEIALLMQDRHGALAG
jgi:hypothetical protein